MIKEITEYMLSIASTGALHTQEAHTIAECITVYLVEETLFGENFPSSKTCSAQR